MSGTGTAELCRRSDLTGVFCLKASTVPVPAIRRV
jgi:hypothetical protein